MHQLTGPLAYLSASRALLASNSRPPVLELESQKHQSRAKTKRGCYEEINVRDDVSAHAIHCARAWHVPTF